METDMHKPIEVLEDFYFFQRDFLSANHFAARSTDGVDLVDTGFVGNKLDTLALLGSVGIDEREVVKIVNTHCHCDHVGGNGMIQGSSGCRILLHSADKALVDAGDRRATWWDFFNQELDPFSCTEGLEDGDEVMVGRHPFEVVHLPGHSPGQIGLFNRSERILLSTDALWPADIGVVNEVVHGDGVIARWLASLERIEALRPALVLPGHGPSFTRVATALGRSRKKLERYAAEPRRMALDLIKRISVYTLLMRGPQPEEGFYDALMESNWFAEVIDHYTIGSYREVYDGVVCSLLRAGALVVKDRFIAVAKK
jgi:glyoxylase-like metal-dependent hydrolase (beta-lactamase superfamily II)